MKLSRVVIFSVLSCTTAYALAAAAPQYFKSDKVKKLVKKRKRMIKRIPRLSARIEERNCVDNHFLVKRPDNTRVILHFVTVDGEVMSVQKCRTSFPRANMPIYYRIKDRRKRGRRVVSMSVDAFSR